MAKPLFTDRTLYPYIIAYRDGTGRLRQVVPSEETGFYKEYDDAMTALEGVLNVPPFVRETMPLVIHNGGIYDTGGVMVAGASVSDVLKYLDKD